MKTKSKNHRPEAVTWIRRMKSLNIFCRRCCCFFPLLYLGCSLDLARYSNIMPHWETLSGWIVLYCNVFRICCRMNNTNQRKNMSLPVHEKANSLLNLQNKSKLLAHLKSPFSSMKRNAPSGSGEQEKVTNVLPSIFNPLQQNCYGNCWIQSQSIKFWTNKPKFSELGGDIKPECPKW